MAAYEKRFWDKRFRGGAREVYALRLDTVDGSFQVICVYLWRGQVKEIHTHTVPAFFALKKNGQNKLKQLLKQLPALAGFEIAKSIDA